MVGGRAKHAVAPPPSTPSLTHTHTQNPPHTLTPTQILVDGQEIPVDEAWRAKYNEAYEGLGARGERVLGFAYRK